jgi:RNA polymerase sigma-70 factor (ECF subfamily)
MFGVAYRMLGSVTEATNLCLNLLTSARARREVHVGPWLPEPVLTDLGEAGRLDDLGPLEMAT